MFWMGCVIIRLLCFFFNDTATTEIYTLSLHDALPISPRWRSSGFMTARTRSSSPRCRDRKSTRLNSSHPSISYAVFCLKKKIFDHLVSRDPNHQHQIDMQGVIVIVV